LLKLRAVGIDIDDVPAGFAEDGLSREEIVWTAISKSLAHYRQKRFEKIVSIGDGIWDVRAAARLELPFLGVGSEDRASILHQAGATHVIKDFTNLQRVIQSLNDAEIPRSKTQG
jgi:phosphoglycolate phosphatase-like HAD superfamily hydrolase